MSNPQRESFKHRRFESIKKSFSYRTSKKPATLMIPQGRDSMRRKTTNINIQSKESKTPHLKSPSLQDFIKIEEKSHNADQNTSFHSDKSPFLTVQKTIADNCNKRKISWDTLESRTFSALSREREIESLDQNLLRNSYGVLTSSTVSSNKNTVIWRSDGKLKKAKKRLAGIKIQKFFKSFVLYRKSLVSPRIFGARIPKHAFSMIKRQKNSNNEKVLIDAIMKRFKFEQKIFEIPKSPKKVHFLKNGINTRNPENFHVLTSQLRDQSKIFPHKSFSLFFNAKTPYLTLQSSVLKEIFISKNSSNKEDSIELFMKLNCGNNNLVFMRSEKCLNVKDENLSYEYVWPLMDEILENTMKERGIADYKLSVDPFSIRSSHNMSEKEEEKLREIIKKLRFLLENKLYIKRKVNGKILDFIDERAKKSDFLLRLMRLKTYLSFRNDMIKAIACKCHGTNPILLDYLGMYIKKIKL